MRGTIGGSGVSLECIISSYSSSAAYAPPIATAVSVSVKQAIARPPYIGFPCNSTPGVPRPATSKSTINASSIAQCAGIRPRSNVIVFEADPLSPIRRPQSSRIVNSLRGATNSSIRSVGLPSSPAIRAWPM